MYLHLDREPLLCAVQGSFQPQSRGGSDFCDQVVTTCVSDSGQGVILAQETHIHALAVASGPPHSSERGLKFEVSVHRPALFVGEESHQPVMSPGFLISQFRTAPYVLTQPVELCRGFVYAAANFVFQLRQHFSTVRHFILFRGINT